VKRGGSLRQASRGRKAQILALLTARRREVTDRIRQTLSERRQEFLDRDAPGSHGWGAAPEGSLSAAILRQQEHLLTQIDAAIGRHAAGTYGCCEECGGDIPVARLEAVPFAQRCAVCQGEWERIGPVRSGRRPGRTDARRRPANGSWPAGNSRMGGD
jgi:DnaK suppressor protein